MCTQILFERLLPSLTGLFLPDKVIILACKNLDLKITQIYRWNPVRADYGFDMALKSGSEQARTDRGGGGGGNRKEIGGEKGLD